MDFFDYLFDNEYKQRTDIEALKRQTLSRKRDRSRQLQRFEDQDSRIEQLEDRVGELALLCRSLLTVLRENGAVTPERFQQVMVEIDAEDGEVDGKSTPAAPDPESPQPPEINPW